MIALVQHLMNLIELCLINQILFNKFVKINIIEYKKVKKLQN